MGCHGAGLIDGRQMTVASSRISLTSKRAFAAHGSWRTAKASPKIQSYLCSPSLGFLVSFRYLLKLLKRRPTQMSNLRLSRRVGNDSTSMDRPSHHSMCLKGWDARLGLKLPDLMRSRMTAFCMFVASYNHKSKRVVEAQDSAASHRLERPRFK
jgi:hypothetical protein